MATNTLTAGLYYDPYFYAQEGLIQLEKALGMASRVFRGYDRSTQNQGSTIQIRKPSTFTAQNAPSSAQNITPQYANITLSNWKEVKIVLTDKEMSLSRENLVDDHIRPMAYAIADAIDQALAALYIYVPWNTTSASTPVAVSDITGVRKVMRGNSVPLGDMSNMHFMVDGTLEAELLNLQAFSQNQGAGATGVETQRTGDIGQRFGFNFFANQNTPTHTTGVSADATGALAADVALGATTISVNAVTAAGTFKAGDTLVIAGNTQRYSITADATATSGGVVSLTISPAAVVAYSTSDVVTITLTSGVQNLAFHRNFAALAMAPLTDLPSELGARVGTAVDPVSNLALRSRIFYDGNNSNIYVALDALYGVSILDGNLAVRLND